MNVVVVESPAKAKTINKYLGSDYHVVASYGHVRDLPPKDGSVDPDNDFEMLWQVDAKAAKRLNDLAKAVKDADRLILATDPDREGEAISWHVLQVLKEKKALKAQPVQRVVFNAITKQAVLDAMAAPRDIEDHLVDAYRARRALDYLVGFNLSPVLWRKLPGSRSAGRVQSVALRLVCDREAEIERFVAQEYWSVIATLTNPAGEPFDARVSVLDGKRLDRLGIKNETDARAIVDHLNQAAFSAVSVEAKPQKRNPAPPFTTSTLQQEASRKLGFSSARTMQTAQKLYEGIALDGETTGLITYMRTDGVQMAPEGISAIRRLIGKDYAEPYLPEKPRYYATKAKNAQEAHEAIRPTDPFRRPAQMKRYLGDDEFRLYDLIWKRAMASQMESAEFERTTVEIDAKAGAKSIGLRATGSVMLFDGFLSVYMEGVDDQEDDEDGRLPKITQGDRLDRKAVKPSQHFTEPPPRFTEATLIKRMEELGIGRPSTYTATLSTLRDREYVTLDKKRLVPGSKGRIVTAFLESFFERYVEYGFTADLEEKLDAISDGKADWREVLREFWADFSRQIGEVLEVRTAAVLDALNEDLAPLIYPPRPDGSDPRICPVCHQGNLSLKTSRYGAFIGCSNYPECNYTREFGDDPNADPKPSGPQVLGIHPDTGLEIALKSGRFGPYIEMGAAADGEKPARSSLPKGWAPQEVTLEKAIQLLSLPREVGLHPETQDPIQAGLGRYGPYLLYGGKYSKLDSIDEVFEIGLNRAVAMIAERKEGKGFSRTPAALKSLGEHPSGGEVTVREGRYGPYVNHGKVNATLPKGTDPQALTLEEALKLIAERAGKTKAAPKGKAKAASSKSKASGTKAKSAAKSKAAKADGDSLVEDDGETPKAKTASKAKSTGAKSTGAKSAGSKKAAASKSSAASTRRSAASDTPPWED
ncbi:type I DNA topoisomerase [Acuticoccus sediminis]|uniref:DNA topoisomerase 1 n=1 Tax=Acuticoccus sediminis TaxID=2184697 RepID=A0A8B2NL98_9HYPH|nr:type I DNA topoisomerase [Acuticoccus sediminis]RAH99320.1 type I DNA topoisomerase [Acuticoccus sediminis]